MPTWAALSPAVLLAIYMTLKRGWRITTSTLLSAALSAAALAAADALGLVGTNGAAMTSIFFLAIIAAALGAGVGTLLRDRANRHA